MQLITVAIADENAKRREKFECMLQDDPSVRVLANIQTIEDVLTTTARLKPRILFISLKHCAEADGEILLSMNRECPETLVVLLADESARQGEQIMLALAKGARGYLDFELDPILVSKAVLVIDRGEAWVPRKMLGHIMDHVLHWCHDGLLTPAMIK